MDKTEISVLSLTSHLPLALFVLCIVLMALAIIMVIGQWLFPDKLSEHNSGNFVPNDGSAASAMLSLANEEPVVSLDQVLDINYSRFKE